jgi:hypothetical protein
MAETTRKEIPKDRRALSSIGDQEWVDFIWIESTEYGQDERHFQATGQRTPLEAAQVMREIKALRAVGF